MPEFSFFLKERTILALLSNLACSVQFHSVPCLFYPNSKNLISPSGRGSVGFPSAQENSRQGSSSLGFGPPTTKRALRHPGCRINNSAPGLITSQCPPNLVRSDLPPFLVFFFISAVLLSGRGLYGSPPRACRYCFLMGQRTSGFGSERKWNGGLAAHGAHRRSFPSAIHGVDVPGGPEGEEDADAGKGILRRPRRSTSTSGTTRRRHGKRCSGGEGPLPSSRLWASSLGTHARRRPSW